MKKQPLSKQIFSLFLALALVLGMVGPMPLSAKADEAAAEAKVLADELKGYTRITATDFESMSNQRLGEAFTLANAGKSNYVGNYTGKTYLDVDVNLGEANTARYFRYMGDLDTKSIYKGAFAIRLYPDKYGVNYVDFAYQDVDTKLNTVVPTKTVAAEDYGITDANSYFNVKILTNIYENAEDATKDVIEYQFWLNDIFVGEGSFTETSHKRMGLCAQVAAGSTLAVRVPEEAKEETPVDPFAGYERITLADYNATMDGTLTASLANGAQLTNQGEAGFDKTYIDVDVNYNGNVGWNSNMVRFYASDRYKDSYNLAWETRERLFFRDISFFPEPDEPSNHRTNR